MRPPSKGYPAFETEEVRPRFKSNNNKKKTQHKNMTSFWTRSITGDAAASRRAASHAAVKPLKATRFKRFASNESPPTCKCKLFLQSERFPARCIERSVFTVLLIVTV